MKFSFLRAIIHFIWFIRALLYPLLYVGHFFIPLIRRRWQLERQILYAKTVNFDYAFSVSSEGEFEQILPLLNILLSANARIQIVYSSPSLTKKITEFHQKHFRLLAVYPLPLLTAPPWRRPLELLKGKYFFVCRYDFYPEIVYYLLGHSAINVLLSGTLKSHQDLLQKRQGFLYYLYGGIYRQFDLILPATDLDHLRFDQLLPGFSGKILPAMDFRVIQIGQRLKLLDQNPKFPHKLGQALAHFMGKKIIIGSAWPQEIDLLANSQFISQLQENKYLLLIAPHRLDTESVGQLKKLILQKISTSSISMYEVRDDLLTSNEWQERFTQGPSVILMLIPGILCELYRSFDLAIVGGGFGKSVHSLLEPFLAGTLIGLGPKVHRSTEYDLIAELAPANIRVWNSYLDVDLEDFWQQKRTPPDIDHFCQLMQTRLQTFLRMIGPFDQ